jgi:serine/threonine protein kinase/GTPase Era involved in 16S rRNA processing
MNTSNQNQFSDDDDQNSLDFSGEMLADCVQNEIPGYQIIDRLGTGGQGSVFLATRRVDGSRVAIKMLGLGSFSNKAARARFRREANALKVLRHRGIVQIIDSGETAGGHCYLVMEFIEGQLLDKYVETLPAGSLLVKLRLFVGICAALEHVHRSGITHRDISPSNIFVDEQGNPRIIDFGLASSAFDRLLDPSEGISNTGDFLGKLDFASPEQILGDSPVVQTSDVYSLGVLLYYLVSNGRLPFNHGGGVELLINRISKDRPDPIPVSRDISYTDWSDVTRVISKALEKLPDGRYQSAGDLALPIANIVARYESNATVSFESTTAPVSSEPIPELQPKKSDYMKLGGFTNFHQRNALIAWAHEIRDLIRTRGDQDGATQIEDAITEFRNDKYSIAVIGKAKRGKSTLLNALLGRKDDLVAPVDKLPASSAITTISYSPNESADVVFRDERCEPITYDQIRSYVTEEGNPKNAKGVACVNVAGPFPGLDHDMQLVDTPGGDSMHEHHDELLHAFIPSADAVIYLISARMPIDASEKELLRKVKATDSQKIFFAINRIDELSAADLADAVRHNSQELNKLGMSVTKLHEISALRAYQGNVSASGLPALCEEMRVYLAENKGKVLARRFIMRVLSIVKPVRDGLEVSIQSAEKTTMQLDAELKKLQAQRAENETKQKFAAKEFEIQWNRALDDFAAGISAAKDEVQKKIGDRIAGSGLSQINTLVKELPSIISNEIEDRTMPLARTFEETVAQASRRYVDSVPGVEMPGMSANVRAQQGPSMAPTALGGVAAIATGTAAIQAGLAFVPAVTSQVVVGSTAPVAYQAAAATGGTLLQMIGSFFGWGGATQAGATVGGMFATTTTTTTTAAAPLWVAMSGPVGWTLIGVGAIAIPIAWRISKLKQKDEIAEATESEISRLFRKLETERVSALRRLGDSVAKDLEIKLQREYDFLESAISEAIAKRPSPEGIAGYKQLASRIDNLLQQTATLTGDR